jgi:hypothetical protein
MKKRYLLLLLFVMTLAACQPAVEVPAATLPAQTGVPTAAPTLAPTQEATDQLSYSSIRYEDLEGKFTIDYPDTWTADQEQVVGDRGLQQLLLSPGSTLESLAEDGSRIILVRYDWDPRNDLAARVTMRKTAWDASGFVILDESTRELEDGRAVVDLLMETPDKQQILFTLTTIGDRYLEIIAEGDIVLGKEILSTLASISQ